MNRRSNSKFARKLTHCHTAKLLAWTRCNQSHITIHTTDNNKKESPIYIRTHALVIITVLSLDKQSDTTKTIYYEDTKNTLYN